MSENLKWMSISQICSATGLSRCWVHRALADGKVQAKYPEQVRKAPIVTSDGEEYGERWMVREDAVEGFFGHGSRTKREDGRSRLILHATPEELTALKAFLAEAGAGATITRQKQAKKTKKTAK